MKEFLKKYKLEVIILALAFLVRIFLLVIMVLKNGSGLRDLVLAGDAFSYYHLASNLKYFFSLEILDVPFFSDAFLRTPIYPAFLYLVSIFFGKSFIAILIVQAIVASASALLIYKMGLLIKLPQKVGLGAALFFAIEPTTALFSNMVLTETLFIFLLLLIFYLFLSGKVSFKKYLLLGLLFGANVLVRPILYPYLVIFLPAILIYLYKEKGLNWQSVIKRGVIFIVGVYIVVFPWIFRNKIVFDTWAVSSISGVHSYFSYAVPFYAYLNGIDKDTAAQQLDLKIVGDKYDLRNNDTYKKAAGDIILDAPLHYGWFHLINSTSFFLGNGYRNIPRDLGFEEVRPAENYSFIRLMISGQLGTLFDFFKAHKIYFLVFIGGAALWVIINLLMAFGVWRGLIRERNLYVLLLLLTIIYFAAVSGPEAYYKMRLPVNAFVFILAFYGGHQLLKSKLFLTLMRKK